MVREILSERFFFFFFMRANGRVHDESIRGLIDKKRYLKRCL